MRGRRSGDPAHVAREHGQHLGTGREGRRPLRGHQPAAVLRGRGHPVLLREAVRPRSIARYPYPLRRARRHRLRGRGGQREPCGRRLRRPVGVADVPADVAAAGRGLDVRGGALRRVRVARAGKAPRRAAVRHSAVLFVRPGGHSRAGRAEPGAGGPAPDLLHRVRRAPARRGGAGWVRRVGPAGRAGRQGAGDAQLLSRRARRDGRHRRPDHARTAGRCHGADAQVPVVGLACPRRGRPHGRARAVRLLRGDPHVRDAELRVAAAALLVRRRADGGGAARLRAVARPCARRCAPAAPPLWCRTMCGIAGLISVDRRADAGELGGRMTAALAQRGPDGEGRWVDGAVALGHRRLAIIDVAGGAQPLVNETGSVRVVCNGEIYNYRALRAELEARGHRFQTASDCETIVHLYEDDGPDGIARLHGMFALAIWDRPARRLVLARDRLGIKPLFYTSGARDFGFASEIKALVAAGLTERQVDPGALHHYLSCGYVPGTTTIYRDRSEEHTSELQSLAYLVCRLLLEKKKKNNRSQDLTRS